MDIYLFQCTIIRFKIFVSLKNNNRLNRTWNVRRSGKPYCESQKNFFSTISSIVCSVKYRNSWKKNFSSRLMTRFVRSLHTYSITQTVSICQNWVKLKIMRYLWICDMHVLLKNKNWRLITCSWIIRNLSSDELLFYLPNCSTRIQFGFLINVVDCL